MLLQIAIVLATRILMLLGPSSSLVAINMRKNILRNLMNSDLECACRKKRRFTLPYLTYHIILFTWVYNLHLTYYFFNILEKNIVCISSSLKWILDSAIHVTQSTDVGIGLVPRIIYSCEFHNTRTLYYLSIITRNAWNMRRSFSNFRPHCIRVIRVVLVYQKGGNVLYQQITIAVLR